jgi:hypothetical protein
MSRQPAIELPRARGAARHAEARRAGRVRGKEHALAEEPGVEPAPQTASAGSIAMPSAGSVAADVVTTTSAGEQDGDGRWTSDPEAEEWSEVP